MKSKTYRSYVGSYLLLLVLPFLILTAFLYNFSVSAERDTEISHQLMLEQLKAGIDSQLYNLMQFGNTMLGNAVISRIAQQGEALAAPASQKYFDLLRETSSVISGITVVNNTVKSAYLYVPEQGRVFSTKGILNEAWFYKASFYRAGYKMEEWLESLNAISGSGLLPINSHVNKYDAGISYGVRFVFGEDAPVFLVLELNADAMAAQVSALRERGVQLAITDRSGGVVFASGPEMTDTIREGSEAPGGSAGQTVLRSSVSDLTGCVYHIAISSADYYRQVNSIRLIIALVFVVIILGGAGLVFQLSHRAYQPLDEILRLLEAPNVRGESGSDDFKYIQNALGRLNNEKKSLDNRLYRQTNIMAGFTLSRLMKGAYALHDNVLQEIELSGLHFAGNFFMVVLVWADESLDEADENSYLFRIVACNIFEELFSSLMEARAVPLGNLSAVLLNSPGTHEEDVTERVTELAEKGRSFIFEHFNFNAYVAISSVFQGLSGIKLAYSEAAQLMEHADGEHPIVDIKRQEESVMTVPFSAFSTETETKLHNLIAVGSGDEAKKLVREELAGLKVPAWKKDIMLADLCAGILRHASRSRLANEQLQTLDRYAGDLLRDKGCTLAVLEAIIDAAAGIFKENDPRNKPIEKRVQEYVRQNFSDCQLNVSSVAEYMGLHVNYISSLYKKYSGESIVDCINSYRLAHAKTLLRRTDLRIEDVARQSGYYNGAALTRSFKKYEGITPGQCRAVQENL